MENQEVKSEEVVEVKAKAKKAPSKADAKMAAYLAGLSSRALEGQIQAGSKKGKEGNADYLAACKAELAKRKKE